MKNVLILGASGNIAGKVIDLLVKDKHIQLTLFLRKARRLRNQAVANSRIIEGDVLNLNDLRKAMTGIDIVYANLAGDLENMATNIVTSMDENGLKRLVFICSIGIYDQPLKPALRPYRRAPRTSALGLSLRANEEMIAARRTPEQTKTRRVQERTTPRPGLIEVMSMVLNGVRLLSRRSH